MSRTSINPQCPYCGLRQHPSHQAHCSKREEVDVEAATPDADDAIERLCYCGKRRDGDSPGCVYHQARRADASTDAMHQQVVVTRLADRHRDNDRDFAESHEVIAQAGPLADVLRQVADRLDLPRGRFTLTIGDPYS